MNDPVIQWTRSQSAFADLMSGVRRRLRIRRVTEGAAIALGLCLLVALCGVLIMDAARFDPMIVSRVRWAVYALVAALLIVILPFRLFARMPDARLARYVERRIPGLDALLLSAAQFSGTPYPASSEPGDISPALAQRLLSNAVETGTGAHGVADLEQTALRRAALMLILIAVIAGLLVAVGPDKLRHGIRLLLVPASESVSANPYSVAVAPGDAVVLQGADQLVEATVAGFAPELVVLASRGTGESEWVRTPMGATSADGAYELFLFDLDTAQEYYVEAAELRSPVHRIDVIPRPQVSRIDFLYQYPSGTGRPPERVENGTDIRTVEGSRVDVEVIPDHPVSGGRLLLDGETEVPLTWVGDRLRGSLDIRQSGHYRVELPAGTLGMVPATPEYLIVAHADALPVIRLSSPGRDTRVTRVEEMEIRVSAEDDVAVQALELVLSVNGGPEEVMPLATGELGQEQVSGTHLMYLEQRPLVPGDLIAYYARARDTRGDGDRQAVTDIFFMDVRPFEQHFRSAGGAGGAGGGGGGQGQQALTAQQRALVVAMFKLSRDQTTLAPALADDRLDTLESAQSRIRVRAEAIARRLGARSMVNLRPGYREVADALPQAVKAMKEVEALLSVADVQQALPQARAALGHLQRADAAFRDVQVAMGSAGGGGGESANELANLFQLEMDKFRNPYEDVQRGRWNAEQNQLDETMRKLRELAQRQQTEVERARRRMQQGAGAGDSQQALAEELEELVRQLERLSRKRDSEALRRSMEQLQSAAQAMRRSGQGQGGEAADASETALDRINQARSALEGERPARLSREVGDAQQRAASASAEQQTITRELESTLRNDPADGNAVSRLARRKGALSEQMRALEADLDRIAASAEADQPATSKALREAAEEMRTSALAERIGAAQRRMMEDPEGLVQRGEADIERELQRLGERLAVAGETIGESGEARLGRALERMRGAIRGLQANRNRLRAGAIGRSAGTGADLGTAELADIDAELGRQVEDLGELLETFPPAPDLAQDIQAVINALQAQREAGSSADPEALMRRHDALLAQIKASERALREGVSAGASTVSADSRAEPGRHQRLMVESYYRNLSEGQPRP
jgi:hypothetical protein